MITISGIGEAMIGGLMTIGFGWFIREFCRMGLHRYRLHRTRKFLHHSLNAVNTLAHLQKFVMRKRGKPRRTRAVCHLEDRLERFRQYVVKHESEINRLAAYAGAERPYLTVFDVPYEENVHSVTNHYTGAMGNAFSNDCSSLHNTLRECEFYFYHELQQSHLHYIFANSLASRLE